MTDTMRALVFHRTGDIGLEEVAVPTAGPGEAVIKVTLTTICGTDVHIMRGEWPVAAGRILGLRPLRTHRFALDEITAAYDLFARQGDGVLKVAIRP